MGQVGPDATTFAQSVSRGTWAYRVQAFSGAVVSTYSSQAQVRIR